MSASGNVNIILAGAAQAETLVQDAAGNPALRSQMAQAMAGEEMARQNQKVPAVEKGDAGSKVRTRADKDGSSGGDPSGGQRRNSKDNKESDEPGKAASPWSGKIVNLKI